MIFQITMSARADGEKGIWIPNPVWSRAAERLKKIYESGGNFSFTVDQDLKPGSLSRCSMRAERRFFLLTAIIFDGDEEKPISWQDPRGTPERGQIDIAGDAWDARWIQTEFVIALGVFKEVFDFGALSENSLLHMR